MNYQENLNKKIEEVKRGFKKILSCSVSYHEEGGWNGKDGHFTINSRNGFECTEKNNWDMKKRFKLTGIVDILKEFQEGVDFTIESKEKVIFHSEKLVNRIIRQWEVEDFFEAIKELIPSAFCSYEEDERRGTFTFKSRKNKKNSSRELEKRFERSAAVNVTYHGKNNQGMHVNSGKLIEANKEKSPNLIEEGKEIKNSPKEICYQPRNERGKEQITEQNKERSKQEKDEKKLEISQQNLSLYNSNFPTSLVVGGGVLLTLIGLTALLFSIKKNK